MTAPPRPLLLLLLRECPWKFKLQTNLQGFIVVNLMLNDILLVLLLTVFLASSWPNDDAMALLVLLSKCPMLLLCKGLIVSFDGAVVAAVATNAAKLGFSVMAWSAVMSNGDDDDDNDDVRFCGAVDAAAVAANVIDVALVVVVESVDGAVDGVDAFSLAGEIVAISAVVVVAFNALVIIVSVTFIRGRSLASVGSVIFIKISCSFCWWVTVFILFGCVRGEVERELGYSSENCTNQLGVNKRQLPSARYCCN